MKKSFLCVLASALLLTSCASTSYIVSNSADLSKYTTAAVNTDSANPPAFYGADVKLFDAMNTAGLKTTGKTETLSMSASQLKETLIVNLGVTTTATELIMTVTFVDASTGSPVASCSGATALSNYSSAIEKAEAQLETQIRDMFSSKIKVTTKKSNLFSFMSKKDNSDAEEKNTESLTETQKSSETAATVVPSEPETTAEDVQEEESAE